MWRFLGEHRPVLKSPEVRQHKARVPLVIYDLRGVLLPRNHFPIIRL